MNFPKQSYFLIKNYFHSRISINFNKFSKIFQAILFFFSSNFLNFFLYWIYLCFTVSINSLYRATKNSYRVSCSLNIKNEKKFSNRQRKELSLPEKTLLTILLYIYEK